MAAETCAFPVSFAQQRVWFLTQLAPESPYYNIGAGVPLSTPIDRELLSRCLDELVRRHESLRTAICTVDGSPMQLVGPPYRMSLPVVDLRALPEALRRAEVRRILKEEIRRPFDLAEIPLFRLTLILVDACECVLAIIMHHLISDAWSMQIFLRELTELYGAFRVGQPSPLPELPIQYADYAVWQRRQLEGNGSKAHLDYWIRQLASLPALHIPADRPRPALPTLRGARVPLHVPAEIATRVRTVCRQEGVTLFMSVLAAFASLLHRYSGQDDIVVGTPVAGRGRAELTSLIGFFVNMLVLRVDLSGDPSLRELLRRVRSVALDAYAHQDVPFERLVEKLGPERDTSRNPLFQVTCQLLQSAQPDWNAKPADEAPTIVPDAGTAAFDLSLDLWEDGQALTGRIEFSTDLFEERSIRGMAAHYCVLLERCFTRPDGRLSELNLLTAEELRGAASGSRGTRGAVTVEKPITRLFRSQVDRTPAAIALLAGGAEICYAEVDRLAVDHARQLRSRSVGAERLVGVYAARSAETVVGLLAVLYAGGAYVPLETASPPWRLAGILRDGQVRIVLTTPQLGDSVRSVCSVLDPSERPDVLTVDLGAVGFDLAASADDLWTCPRLDDLAYIIYTSGATGRPKGCLIQHGSLAHHSVAMAGHYELRPGDRVLQFADPAFDVAAEEIFPTFLSGATLVMISDGALASYAELTDFLARHRITVINLPAAFWHGYLSYLVDTSTAVPSTLRLCIVGSDVVSRDQLARWQAAVPPDRVRLYNAYGVSEATITSTLFHVPPDCATRYPLSVPIGRPIGDTGVFVLDRYGQPLPRGIVGELHIGGPGLARGYLGRPELTADRFVDRSIDGRTPIRLYRTGDRVRYLPDGNLEFLGRVDQQVNVRGYRVEVGEIENILAEHPLVEQVVVEARPGKSGEKQLAAYLVAAAGDPAPTQQIRSFAMARLPRYMVPASFTWIERLPLTPSGKVDRGALPAPASHAATRHAADPRSATEQEQMVARIWADVLDLDRVGLDDNFFELGGDSILAIQIVARAAQAGLSLMPSHLFQHQTVAELAAAAKSATDLERRGPPLEGPAPLTPIQEWFFAQDLPSPHHYNQAVLMRIEGGLDVTALRGAVRCLLLHHDALRLRYTRRGDEWSQEAAPPRSDGPFCHEDLSDLPEPEQRAAVDVRIAELQSSLTLSDGPLIRVAAFLLGPGTAEVLFIAHHLVVDGVSWRILLEDLKEAYRQLVTGTSAYLPPVTTPFTVWAAMLGQLAESAELRQDLAYYLALPLGTLQPLPVDHRRGPNIVASADTIAMSLSAARTEALLREVPKASHSRINEVLLTALALALRDWSGSETHWIDLEGHGREPIFDGVDVSRTVGWFTCVHPVLLAPGTSDPRRALTWVKEHLRQVPRYGIGFGLLRHPRRDTGDRQALRGLPDPELCFNYMGQFGGGGGRQDLWTATTAHDAGPTRAPNQKRSHLLDVNGHVSDGRLHTAWTFSRNLHRPESIRRLVGAFETRLAEVTDHCRIPGGHGFTPADFPLARLSQDRLDRLVRRLSKRSH